MILTQCFFEQHTLSDVGYNHNIGSGRQGADREVLVGGLILWTGLKGYHECCSEQIIFYRTGLIYKAYMSNCIDGWCKWHQK